MLTRIHVNRHKATANRRNGTTDPVIAVRRGRTVTYHHEVAIEGPSKLVYRPDKPLSCGATTWLETQSEVVPLF